MQCEHLQFYLTWVVTLVSSCAHVLALWWFCATGDGRVQDSEPTVTRQLVKTCKQKNQGATWDMSCVATSWHIIAKHNTTKEKKQHKDDVKTLSNF